MIKMPVRKVPNKRTGWSRCYLILGITTLISACVIFYSWLFRFLSRNTNNSIDINTALVSPAEAGNLLGEAAHTITDRLKWLKRCPKCECSSTVPSADGTMTTTADPDAWLDHVNDHPPPIVPSHYAMVHGMEPWERQGLKVWELHNIPNDDWYEKAKKATDRCDLELHGKIQGAEHGLEDKVVWVTALFDLKRGEGGMGDFQRGMDEYYRRFQTILDRGFQMVVFLPPDFEQHLKIDYNRVKVIHMNATDLHWYFPYYDRVQQIRTSALWKAQGEYAGWLIKSPQARLEGYNPLVMIKLKMLQDAARLNVWGSRYHMWMDAGHLCAGALTPSKMNMYRKHMAKALLVTHWPYGTTTEVHGLTDKAMHLYLGTADDPLQIVRGGIFGGTLPYIECTLKAYMIALHQTLSDGYMGTEECIWAMIFARFPHLFAGFDNNSLGNHGDNCASFQKNNMEEDEIAQGKREPFVSAPIPDKPSWWDADLEAKNAGVRGGNSNNTAPKRTIPKTIDQLLKSGAIGVNKA